MKKEIDAIVRIDSALDIIPKNKDNVKRGKKSRKEGNAFEKFVRKDLIKQGWIVAKWTNNVEFEEFATPDNKYGGVGRHGKLVPSKPKFNPFTHSLMMNSSGFPDFIAYTLGISREDIDLNSPGDLRLNEDKELDQERYYLIGVESKINGKLDKEEKEKCKWLLENNIFSKILICSKGEKKGEIIYNEFNR